MSLLTTIKFNEMLGTWAASRKEALKILTTLSLDAVASYTSNNDMSKMEIIYNKLLDEDAEAELHMVKTFFQRVTNVVFFLDTDDLEATGKCAAKGAPKEAMNKIILECESKGIQLYAKKARTKKMAKSLAAIVSDNSGSKARDDRSDGQKEVDKGEYNDIFNKLSEAQKTSPELAKKAQEAIDAILSGESVVVGADPQEHKTSATSETSVGIPTNIFQDDEANTLFGQIVADLKDIDSCGKAVSSGSKKVEAVHKLRSSLRNYAQQTKSIRGTFNAALTAIANKIAA